MLIMTEFSFLAHINNIYNTVFWALVQQGGQTTKEANETLLVCINRFLCIPPLIDHQGTNSAQKNEILFSQFNINYNSLPSSFRKGSILLRERIEGETVEATKKKNKASTHVAILHCDLIGDEFWDLRPHILAG